MRVRGWTRFSECQPAASGLSDRPTGAGSLRAPGQGSLCVHAYLCRSTNEERPRSRRSASGVDGRPCTVHSAHCTRVSASMGRVGSRRSAPHCACKAPVRRCALPPARATRRRHGGARNAPGCAGTRRDERWPSVPLKPSRTVRYARILRPPLEWARVSLRSSAAGRARSIPRNVCHPRKTRASARRETRGEETNDWTRPIGPSAAEDACCAPARKDGESAA